MGILLLCFEDAIKQSMGELLLGVFFVCCPYLHGGTVGLWCNKQDIECSHNRIKLTSERYVEVDSGHHRESGQN